MRQRSQFVVISLVSLLLMTGCSGDAVDSEQQPPESSPTVATTPPSPDPTDSVPTPEPLPLPEIPEDLMPEDTAENAIRAAEYFVDLINYMQSTGDTEPFEKVSTPVCEFCKEYSELYQSRYSGGGYVIGAQISLTEIEARRTHDDIAWEVTADWEITDGVILDERQAKERKSDAVVLPRHRMAVQLYEEEWWVVEVAQGVK